MKKQQTKRSLTEVLDNLQKLSTGKGTSCYKAPIVPSDCPSYTDETADYIRENIKLYVQTWIVPRIEKAIAELSK